MRPEIDDLLSTPTDPPLTKPFSEASREAARFVDTADTKDPKSILYSAPISASLIEATLDEDPEHAGRILDRWVECVVGSSKIESEGLRRHHLAEAFSFAATIPPIFWHPEPLTVARLARLAAGFVSSSADFTIIRVRVEARIAGVLRRLGYSRAALRLLSATEEIADRARLSLKQTSEARESRDILLHSMGVHHAAIGDPDAAMRCFVRVLNSPMTPIGSPRWFSTMLEAAAASRAENPLPRSPTSTSSTSGSGARRGGRPSTGLGTSGFQQRSIGK